MNTHDIHSEYRAELKKSLKNFFGRKWATRVAEKDNSSPSWVRQCFRGAANSDSVFTVAEEIVKEKTEARGEFLKNNAQ